MSRYLWEVVYYSCDRIGKHNFRIMGLRSDSGMLQTKDYSKTSFLRHKRNSYQKLSNQFVRKRNRESFKLNAIERVWKRETIKVFYSTLFLVQMRL